MCRVGWIEAIVGVSKMTQAIKLVMSVIHVFATFYALQLRKVEQLDAKAPEHFHTGEHNEHEARNELAASEIDGDSVEGHSLGFMDRDCPSEHQWQPILI